jgi:hypothetical protein
MQAFEEARVSAPPPDAWGVRVVIDQYTEDDIYRIFGTPKTEPPETQSGDRPSPEAPRYFVEALYFLSSEENIIHKTSTNRL